MGNFDDANLLHKIKETVVAVQPEADVILYGSHARGTSTTMSDWDLLILVPHDSRAVRQAVRRRLYEIEWAGGEVISVVIREKGDWNHPRLEKSPFHHNVETEGIWL